MAPLRKIIFCATPRTGSMVIFDDFFNLLGGREVNAELLLTSVIEERRFTTWAETWAQVEHDNAVADIVAVKVMINYTPYISHFIGGDAAGVAPFRNAPFSAEHFNDFFAFFRDALWVYIDRKNVCAQATSIFVASKTGKWEQRTGAAKKSESSISELVYDQQALFEITNRFLFQKRQWEAFFSYYGVRPIRIEYEDAVSHYPEYLDEFFRTAKLTPTVLDPPRRLARVGKDTSREFENRLRREWTENFGESQVVG